MEIYREFPSNGGYIDHTSLDTMPKDATYEVLPVVEPDLTNQKVQRAIEIDLEYTDRISNMLQKHIEKKNLDGMEIPQIAYDDRDRLRAECNARILEETGITDYSYRQSIPKLAKF